MVRGVSNARVQTPTVQPSEPAAVQKETKTPASVPSQEAKQKPANNTAMKSEHKLGGQLKSAQLQSQLPGVYQIVTGQKTEQTPKDVQLPGVYKLATGQGGQAPSNKVELPGVYEIATGSDQKNGAKRPVMDFSKGPAFDASRHAKSGLTGEFQKPELLEEGMGGKSGLTGEFNKDEIREERQLEQKDKRPVMDFSKGPAFDASRHANSGLTGEFQKPDLPVESRSGLTGEFQQPELPGGKKGGKSSQPPTGLSDAKKRDRLKIEAHPKFAQLSDDVKKLAREELSLGEGKKNLMMILEHPALQSLSPAQQKLLIQNASLNPSMKELLDVAGSPGFQRLNEETKTFLLQNARLIRGKSYYNDLKRLINDPLFLTYSPQVRREELEGHAHRTILRSLGAGFDHNTTGLSIGDKSPQVRDLQKMLGVEQTGRFDINTLIKIVQFQKDKGLPINGIADAKTIEKLRIAIKNA